MTTLRDRAVTAGVNTGIGTSLIGISALYPPAGFALMPIWWIHLLVSAAQLIED